MFIKAKQWHIVDPGTPSQMKNGLPFTRARCGVNILTIAKKAEYITDNVCPHCKMPVAELKAAIRKINT